MALGIAFAVDKTTEDDRNRKQSTYKEVWVARWTPDCEINLVDNALLGDTIEIAAARKLGDALATCADILAAAELVKNAVLCDLHDATEEAFSRVQALSVNDGDFVAISTAALELSYLAAYRDVRKFDLTPLEPLVAQLFLRGMLLAPESSRCNEDAARNVGAALASLHHVAHVFQDKLDEERFVRTLDSIADDPFAAPHVAGVACAILLERGKLSDIVLDQRVSRRLSPGVSPTEGAGFFEGLATRNRYALLARKSLWSAMNAFIETLDDEAFKRAVVALRRAFGSFETSEARRIANVLADVWGGGENALVQAIETKVDDTEIEALQADLAELGDLDFDMAKKNPAHSATTPAPTPAPGPAPAAPMSFDRVQRWRLILGKRVEDQLSGLGGGGAGGSGGLLSREMLEMDAALGAVYDVEEAEAEKKGGGRRGGLGKSRPKLAAWLGDVRKYFEQDIVAVIQQDAIEKKDWKELLFEPEALAQITPSVELVGTLLSMKDMIPDRAKEAAREIVRAVVEEIKKRMQGALERAVRGALDRSRHQPIPSLPNIDWRRTISKNLKNYEKTRRTIVPERFFFYARQHRRKEWNVIVAMDQSGSMASSVVYGGVMGSILASLPALETHVVAFDTEVVDLTPRLVDPVDLLFGIQLGGGTDINRAVGYCQGLITNPQKTLLILLTDLFEGGNQEQMVRRMEDLARSGVRAMVLLALDDSGAPSFDVDLAKKLGKIGVPSFACTPNALPPMLEAALKGQNLEAVAQRFDSRKGGG